MANPNLVIGTESVRSDAVTAKVSQDIAFLADRLARIERQAKPNPQVIKVYRDMLESRYAVLEWLTQGRP